MCTGVQRVPHELLHSVAKLWVELLLPAGEKPLDLLTAPSPSFSSSSSTSSSSSFVFFFLVEFTFKFSKNEDQVQISSRRL